MLSRNDNIVNTSNVTTSTIDNDIHKPPQIHINPNFCNIIANTMQNNAEKIQTHINPRFLYRTVPQIHMNPSFFPKQRDPTTINATSLLKATSGMTITTTTTPAISMPENSFVEKNRMKVVRHPSTKTLATCALKTNVLSGTRIKSTVLANNGRVNKYKLDKREPKKLSAAKTKHNKIANKIRYNSSIMTSLHRKVQTLNINGMLYKSTGTKLQLKDTKCHRAVAIHPQRLARQLNIRSHVNIAKQRSLQVLRQRFVKTNIPCRIFRRLGKCVAYEAGRCNKVHDKKYVIICQKFLKDECSNSDCLLSHDISLNKMPVCRYFLQAQCIRDKCLYLHKKLNADALMCPDFFNGYCPLAEKVSIQIQKFTNFI